jgi:hypothetical protein
VPEKDNPMQARPIEDLFSGYQVLLDIIQVVSYVSC